LQDCVGSVTILLNSYHSGEWHIAAREMGPCLDSESGGVTIISRGYNQEEIFSHPESASEGYREGYFMNVVKGGLYKEYDSFLLRPEIIEGRPIGTTFRSQTSLNQSAPLSGQELPI